LKNKNFKSRYWNLLPVMGIVVFALLYVIATLHYPGGSQFDKESIGFSWKYNYWCNLLNDKAINGSINSAQTYALTAMTILCFSLIFFWIRFPEYTLMSKFWKLVIKVSGTSSMVFALFLFTNLNHDFLTNLASGLGLLAMMVTFAGLAKNRWFSLLKFGLFNILLVIVNNILYYNESLIIWLPIVQKISFASVLLWICLINIKIYKLKHTG
jgi:hypothetical protein